jgi:hypothetical protein
VQPAGQPGHIRLRQVGALTVRVSEGDLGRYTLSPDRVVTPRRNLEQALHCAEEALGVLSRKEDAQLAFEDLAHAQELVICVRDRVRVRLLNGGRRG